MTFAECCGHHSEQLRRVFPGANVIEGRIEEHRDEIDAKQGEVDCMDAFIPCQPASDATPVHRPDDDRLGLIDEVAERVAKVKPRSFLLEDVVGLKKNQPAAYERLKKLLCAAFTGGTVVEIITNARECMTGHQRKRLFFV